MLLQIYRLLSFISSPLLMLWFSYRQKIGKEDRKRFPERCGKAGFPRPDGPLIWIHGASVGEILSVLPLIKIICERYPDIHILVTTGTVTSAKILETRLPKKIVHQYVPIDKLPFVKRFLAHWRPDFAIFIESELWPNLIIETSKTGCPMAQINGRMSVKSFQMWQKYNSLSERMLECFNLILAQSHEDKDRFTSLGAPNAKYLGNLKYDAMPLPADPKETGKLITMIHNRPVWVAASTHPGEEELIADAHQKLKEDFPNLLLILIPRHPERGGEISALLNEKSITTALRSKDGILDDSTQVYIADTIGELGIFYRLSGIVFMGGSLVEHGGQNPLEAARLECALLVGPHTFNFTKMYKELEIKNAILRITNEDELYEHVHLLIKDHEKQEKLSNTALALMESKKGILDDYIQELTPFLEPLSGVKLHADS